MKVNFKKHILKLTVLNPKGRIWILIAGGGASDIYADTILDLRMFFRGVF